MKLIKGSGLGEGEARLSHSEKHPKLHKGTTAAHPRTQAGMEQIADDFRRLAHFHQVNMVGLLLDEGPKGEGGRDLSMMFSHTCTVPRMTHGEVAVWGSTSFAGIVESNDWWKEGMLPSPSAHYAANRKKRMGKVPRSKR